MSMPTFVLAEGALEVYIEASVVDKVQKLPEKAIE